MKKRNRLSSHLLETIVFISHNMRMLKAMEEGAVALRRRKFYLTAEPSVRIEFAEGTPGDAHTTGGTTPQHDLPSHPPSMPDLPLVDAIPIKTDMIDDDDEYEVDDAVGNGIDMDLRDPTFVRRAARQCDACYYDERSAHDLFINYAPSHA